MNAAAGVAVTVLGPVRQDDLGAVLPHEHVTIDNSFNAQPVEGIEVGDPVEPTQVASSRVWPRARSDNLRLDQDAAVIEALEDFKDAGGGCLVEMTTVGNGRDFERMRHVSQVSGIHIVATTGLYVDQSHPSDVRLLDVDALTSRFVAELTTGSSRCGAIGEVGLSRTPTDGEWRSLEAATLASGITGAPLWIHITTLEPLPALLQWASDHQIAHERTVICHMDHDLRDLALHRAALEQGFLLEFDQFGYPAWTRGPFTHAPTDAQRVEALLRLAAEGWETQLLMSHDVCQKIQLPQLGGYGYSHIERNVQRLLHEMGGSPDLYVQITRRTPQRLLCWATV